MAEKSKIEVVGKYINLLDEPIKQSFQKVKVEAVDMSKEFDTLRRSISASMGHTRKAIVQAMEQSSAATRKHTKEVGRHARTMGAEIGKIAGQIGSIRNTMLVWMFALRPFINIISASTKAMMEQEDAIKRINYAMGIQGTQSEFMSKKLIDLSQSFMKTTRYGDELIMQVFSKLAIVGIMPTQFEKITKAVLDFAAATGRDPVAVAERFALAAQGNTMGLRRWGIAIDEATPKGKILGAILEYVNKQMRGRAQQDVDSYSGKMSQLGIAFNESQESLGFFIAEAINLEGASVWLKNFFQGIADRTTIPITQLEKFNKELKYLNETLNMLGVTKPRKIFGIELPDWLASENEMLNRRKELLSKIGILQAEDAAKVVLSDIQAREEEIKQIKLKAEEDFNIQYTALESVRLQVARDAYNEDVAKFKAASIDKVKTAKWAAETERNLYLAEKAARRKHPALESAEDAADTWKDYVGKNGQAYIDMMTAFAKGARDALVDGFISVVKGDFEGLGEIVNSFGNLMLQTLAQIAINAMMIKIGFGVFLGLHTGGYIQAGRSASAGYARRKYHSGGEVDATLLEGEGVVNQKGMRSLGVDNLNKLNRGEGAGGGDTVNNYYIQAIDVKSFRDRLQEHGDIYASASDSAIRDNGNLRKTSQRWG